MYIKGFKTFLKGMKTLEGNLTLQVGNTYHIDEPIQFEKNGFHFCKRLEDTLHYFTNYHTDIDICAVTGFGNVLETSHEYYGYYDIYIASESHEYYGYYDIYIASDLKIDRLLSKQEILDMYKELIEHSVCSDQRIARFLAYYPNLTEQDYQYLGIQPKQYKLRYY